MSKEELCEYIEEEYGIVVDYPFSNEKVPTPIFRHKDNKKWFAAAIFVQKCKVTGKSDERVWVLCVKCDQIIKSALLEKKGFYPAYHMNKQHWISLILEEADDEDLKFAVSMSYDLTGAKYKKRKSA